MTKDDIITTPNPLLHQKSKRVAIVDESTRALAEEMIRATLDWEDSRKHEFGAALAAVQIASMQRLIVIRNDFEDKADRSFAVFINPEIVKAEGKLVEDTEGCLSVLNIYGNVSRYERVKVKALNLDGKEVRLTVEGFLARVFQHEIDHTNGLIFLDRISDKNKLFHLDSDGEFIPLTASDKKKLA